MPDRSGGVPRPIAALFVLPDGPYTGLPDVDCWDESRDARLYSGPHPVVAHPPCARWGRYWHGGPSATVRQRLGDDGGCFAAALSAVRRWGGVLEHPADSHAWRHFGLLRPPQAGGWIMAGDGIGWTCCVYQFWYGHPAQKATWLYAVGTALPSLDWRVPPVGSGVRLDDGFQSAAEQRRRIRTGRCQRLSHRQRQETPIQFRDILITMVRSV